MGLIDKHPCAATAMALDESMVIVAANQNLQARPEQTDPLMSRLPNIFTQHLRAQARVLTKITSSPLINK